jgi:hypothetical protein
MPDQFVVVEIPGVGNVEFPSSMSQTAIAQASAKLYKDAQASKPAAVAPRPSNPAQAPSDAPDLGGAVGRFAGGLASSLLPSTTASDYIEGPLYALRHPIDSLGLVLGAIKDAHLGQASQAVDNFRQGRYAEAAGHGLASVLPVVGPAAAAAGEQIASGDIAGGLGAGVGLLAPSALSAARGRVPVAAESRIPGIGATRNPVEAAAVQFAHERGIPVDAATATGSPFIRRLQKRVGETPLGSGPVRAAREAQEAALARVGEQIAGDVHPFGVDAVTAGEQVREQLTSNVRERHAEATRNYDQLRAVEADPANARTFTTEPAPGTPEADYGRPPSRKFSNRFAEPDTSAADMWPRVLGDARQQGFKGNASDLKAEFTARIKQARALEDEMTAADANNGPRALMAEIRRMGGIRPFEVVNGNKLAEEFRNVQGAFEKGAWGQRGGGSVFRKNGLGLDDVIDQLQAQPRFKGVITSGTDLLEALKDIADQGPQAINTDLEHLLAGAGVERGKPWWQGTPAERTETINLPVDLRTAKSALKPIYDELMASYPTAQQEASRGLKAIANIVNGPDRVPLSVADRNLGAIKAIARTDLPELRSVSQGMAAQAVKELSDWVSLAAEGAGPEALQALERGRKATIEKYQAGNVLEALSTEPRRVFDQLTVQKDGAIERLRSVQKEAPDRIPVVARAFLEELMNKATAEGGFRHTDRLYADWQKLGDQTKGVLFPGQVENLDRFFALAKKLGENPNPSGTGGQLSLFNAWAAIPAYTLAKILYSPGGVRRLTNGVRLPRGAGRATGRTAVTAGRLQSAAVPQ